MHFIPLFFICTKMFHFINYREVAFFIQNFALLLRERRRNPNRKHVIIIDSFSVFVIIYFICDILYMFYCIWLMTDTSTWDPGCILLFISALESAAVHFGISGTYTADPRGFVYPSTWFRYLTFGMNLFILLKLFEG